MEVMERSLGCETILSFRRDHTLVCFGDKTWRDPRVGLSGWNPCSGERSLSFGCWLGRLLRGARLTGRCLRERGTGLQPSTVRFPRCLSASLPSFLVTLFGKGNVRPEKEAGLLFFSHKYPQCSTLFPYPSLPVLLPSGSTDRCCSVPRSLRSPPLLSFPQYLQSTLASLTALRRFEA